MSEYWDVYDKFRNRTNKTIQRDSDERLKNGEYHIVVTGIVENSNKQILITRRNKNKKLYPGLWECTGGSAKAGESSIDATIREIKEELNIDCEIDYLIDVWMYNILNKVNAFIVTYLCKNLEFNIDKIRISNEHKEVGFFSIQDIDNLKMPNGYKNSIKKSLHGQ